MTGTDRGASDRTRTAILRAAASALRGGDAGMGEIARVAGVGRATLYRHFPNREGLLVELGAYAAAESLRALREASLDAVDVPTAVARAARALLTVGRAYWVHSTHLPERRADEQEVGRRVAALVERGRAEGALRADIPAPQLAALFGSLVIGALTQDELLALDVEDAAEAITRIFLDGARA
ncbi:TetR family transcriptional regulator [Actinorhabdospora filicis]|uniref:TetR family transcriptional regulator n=1 Tax=Actinorhabdospora filicis TaxID=1785913 RepID=A0A9W6SH07_9ACTN|nr:TetR/AcrR family transcriptional regulator [Actinorhabdospora filicis]GLZ75249.1 TetR family transcriptional regulator [Actinorhabdospora filicis]